MSQSPYPLSSDKKRVEMCYQCALPAAWEEPTHQSISWSSTTTMAGSPADDLTFLQAFANLLGAPEPALRLLISILIGKFTSLEKISKNESWTWFAGVKRVGVRLALQEAQWRNPNMCLAWWLSEVVYNLLHSRRLTF